MYHLIGGLRRVGRNKFKAFQGYQSQLQPIFKAANDKTGGSSDRHTLLVNAVFNNFSYFILRESMLLHVIIIALPNAALVNSVIKYAGA